MIGLRAASGLLTPAFLWVGIINTMIGMGFYHPQLMGNFLIGTACLAVLVGKWAERHIL